MPVDPNANPIGVPNPDIGAALQQYAADPTQDAALLQDVQALNLPFGQQTTQFLQDELAMQTANGWGDHLTGYRLPPGISSEDFLLIAGFAHDWAAMTGFKTFPTWAQINYIAAHGVTDRLEAYASFSGWQNLREPGWSGAHPWAAAGLSKSQYQDQVGSYIDTVEELTGSRDANLGAFGFSADTAVQQRWTPTRWRHELVQKLGQSREFGYLRHGMNFQQWQQYQTENANSIRQRFGTATPDFALRTLDQPLQAQAAAGGPAATSQQQQARLTVGQSEVR